MQFAGQAKPPVGIIFDCDMGNSIDAALALALLYGLDGKNEARVVSISVSKSNLKSAAYCEAFGRFYAGAVSGAFNSAGRTLPVGMAIHGKDQRDTPMLTVPLAKVNAKGDPVYAHGIHKLNDTAEVAALIRNAFTAQHDENALVVLAGPATNLAQVLDLPGAKELIAKKVRLLAVAAGAYPAGKPEPHIQADIAAAKKVFAEWPTPIVASGYEVGEALRYPASSIEKDFGWTEDHPVVDAYRAYKPMPYDAPTWDMSPVLYAIRTKEEYFQLSAPGTITVNDDASTRFSESAGGKHRYLIVDPAQRERIIKAYVELVSARPVPKQPRIRPPKKDEKPEVKPAEVKPEDPKVVK
ncbi:MAG TPA: nucleoside hydrolase [Bryobacteraceae bacterium]|nr:nucleoside hydrolase [Bryobacteraceae bacterium]